MKFKLITTLTLFFILLFPVFSVKAAEVKDSDFDGILDTKEVGTYKTNPFKADTDGDTYSDLVEIKYKTDPLNANSKPQVDTNNVSVDSGKYYWLFSRASGVTAFILLSVGVCFGMGMSTRSAYKYLRPPIAMEIHNTINVIALFAVVLHFIALLFDSYFYLKIQEALIPFLVERKFKSELGFDFKWAIGLGIVAFYFITILVITSLYRSKISIKLWRKIHYLSFFTYIIFVMHGITSGSDSHMLWMQIIYGLSIFGFLGLFIYRIATIIRKKIAAKKIVEPAATTTLAPEKIVK